MKIRLKSTVIFIIAFVLFVTTILITREATTQDKESQQSTQQQEMLKMMGPMMGKMMESMMEAMFTTMAKPQTAELLATFSKNYYDALIAKGFSKEDALRIVTSVGIPSIPSMK